MEGHDAARNVTSPPKKSMPVLPEEIIYEILSHCTGSFWTQKRLAALCLVQKGAWLSAARRALYRKLTLGNDWRQERLLPCLSLNRDNASLVHKIHMSGDIYVPDVVAALQCLPAVKKVTLISLNLPLDTQQDFCQAVAAPALTALSLLHVPHDLATQILKLAAPQLRHVHIWSVRLDLSSGWEQDDQWDFARLEHLELILREDFGSAAFRQLVERPSSRLKHLRLQHTGTYPSASPSTTRWHKCHFDNLHTLHLTGRQLSVIERLLMQCVNGKLLHLSINHYDEQFLTGPPYVGGSSAAALQLPEDRARSLSLLSSFPKSVQHLEIFGSLPSSLISGLADRIRHDLGWLPQLQRLPRIRSVHYDYVSDQLDAWKKSLLEGAQRRGLRYSREEDATFFEVRTAVSS